MATDIVTIALWSAFLLASSSLVFVMIRYMLIQKIRSDILNKVPKEEMVICDKNHCYPKKHAMNLKDIPGLESDVLICPYCFDNNMRLASKIPDAKTTDVRPKS